MNRRRFFQRSASVWVSSLLPQWAGSASLSRKRRIHIGAETNAFGVPIKPLSHLLELVSTLSKLGYEGFETNTRCLEEGRDQPAKVRREFEARDIRLISAYSHGGLYTRELADRTIAENRRIAHYVAAMGASYLILGGPRLAHVDGKLDMTAVHNTTEGLNRLGEAVQKEGLKLCYHNHWMEFEDDPSEMSFILKETDPQLVWLNYDIGNCYIHHLGFGPNPAAFSREHFRRIAIYHIKDVGLNSQGKAVNTELGAGRIGLKDVVAPLLQSDWEGWLTVEQEGNYPKGWQHPVAVMRQARDYLALLTSSWKGSDASGDRD